MLHSCQTFIYTGTVLPLRAKSKSTLRKDVWRVGCKYSNNILINDEMEVKSNHEAIIKEIVIFSTSISSIVIIRPNCHRTSPPIFV